MTGNKAKSLAQKRVKTVGDIDWDDFFQMVIDDIFTRRKWSFNQLELESSISAGVATKTFAATDTELALNKIVSIRQLLTPAEFAFVPVQSFYTYVPNPTAPGVPCMFTILRGNDGLSGMKIRVWPVPTSDTILYVLGDFIPAVGTAGAAEIPILPKQFHSMVVDGMVFMAAEQMGKNELAATAEKRYERRMVHLIEWDQRNPKFHLRRLKDGTAMRRGPFMPSNFPDSGGGSGLIIGGIVIENP